jgi:glycosyltransferase involved in cell wall biosynthesis
MAYMKNFFHNPSWIDCRLLNDLALEEIPGSFFDEINEGLKDLQSDDPFVSIVIPALNEEVNILRTLHSLSRNTTRYETEVIVVNNNSTDRTQEVLNRLNVRNFFQAKPGWGPARQMGQERARGKYILMADADCFYPPRWIEYLTTKLLTPGVTCVYGGYSFLGSAEKSRWKYSVYEGLRMVVAEIRNIKRPWLNCVGMCMGYVRDLGVRIGFIDRKISGEDGRMCYELAQFGKILRVRSRDAVVWTYPRTLQKDGSLINAILNRAVVELGRFGLYFKNQAVHDTHTSLNTKPPALRYSKKNRAKGQQREPREIEM